MDTSVTPDTSVVGPQTSTGHNVPMACEYRTVIVLFTIAHLEVVS